MLAEVVTITIDLRAVPRYVDFSPPRYSSPIDPHHRPLLVGPTACRSGTLTFDSSTFTSTTASLNTSAALGVPTSPWCRCNLRPGAAPLRPRRRRSPCTLFSLPFVLQLQLSGRPAGPRADGRSFLLHNTPMD